MASGLDGLWQVIGGRRVGLVTGPSGWLGAPGHLIDLLHERGLLRALFAPEHGVWGDLQAGAEVPGGLDRRTNCPVHSLFGADRVPTADMLADIDVLVGCLQDSGARPYTFQTTLADCLTACRRHGVPMVVFDRPTPLGGLRRQGNVAAGWFFPEPLPMRPGLTIGERLRLWLARTGARADLTVVPWFPADRARWFDELPLPWVAPSPNLPTVTSAVCFAGTVLLEATNVSEGRGTTRPFELVGAPWIDGHRLRDALAARPLPGFLFRATAFCPTFSKCVGEICHGVQVHVTDRQACDPPRLGLHLLDVLTSLWPDTLEVRPAALDGRFHGAAVREAWQAGTAVEELAAGWDADCAAFDELARSVWIGADGWSAT